jgi:hypothetical protein
MGILPGTLSPANFRRRFAALRLGVFALNPFSPIVHPKMNTGKEPGELRIANFRMRSAKCAPI